MATAVTGLLQPATPEEEKRRRGVVLGAAATSILSLVGGIIFLLFSGQTPPKPTQLKPRTTTTTVASAPPTTEAPSSGDLLGAMGANYADTGSSSAVGLTPQGASAPIGGAVPSSPLQLPPGPQAQPIDWGELLAPTVQSQQDAIAAGLTGAITAPVVNAVSSGFNSSAILLGDIFLYAAYTNGGAPLLNQLQTAIPAAAVAAPALAAAGTVPAADFSGLNSAFAAASALPPVGLPAPPQLPQLPPLPTPEQVTAALSALPALPALGALPALPPPPQLPGLPTPEQALLGASAGAAAIAAIPALLPPIGLPSLPPIGLPSLPPIGLPTIGLPSITRLLGLPF